MAGFAVAAGGGVPVLRSVLHLRLSDKPAVSDNFQARSSLPEGAAAGRLAPRATAPVTGPIASAPAPATVVGVSQRPVELPKNGGSSGGDGGKGEGGGGEVIPPKEEPKEEEKEEPTTPPPPPPPAEEGEQLFEGSQVNDFQLLQAAPGAITEVTDPKDPSREVLKMTVDNDDVYPITPTSDPRAQLLSPDVFEPGDEFWWNSEFLLPPDFPASTPGWVTVLEGPYGPPFAGTPPWHIEINGNQMEWGRNSTYNWDIPWSAPLIRNQWVHVLVHERFGHDGWVEMWINGVQIKFFDGSTFNPNGVAETNKLEMETLDSSNDGGTNFAVILNYREADTLNQATVYQGPMRIGETRESVEPTEAELLAAATPAG